MDKNKIKMIIITSAYVVGIILDGLLGIDMLLYTFFGTSIYIQNQNIPLSSIDTQPVMMLGTALMIGWTILLLWGLKKPIGRKGTILITAIPVVSLYIIYDIFQYVKIIQDISIFMILTVRCCLFALLIIAYIFAYQMDKLN